MTKNITMAIDEDLLKKARKIAIDKNVTLTALIREYLEHIIQQEQMHKSKVVTDLNKLFDSSDAKIGRKKWRRDDLYER